MFLKIPFYFFVFLCLGSSFGAHACATGEHHSTTFHYNNAQKVFVGVFLEQQKSQQRGNDTTWLTFRIKKAYKNCKAGQVVRIQGNAYTTALLKRKSCHLVYAEATFSEALYCPKLEALKTTNTSRQLAVLEQIIVHPLGEVFIEYSPYGRVWSKGYYNKGIPYHGWEYYAYSGELKIKAQYLQGLRSSQWNTYAHTKDEDYKILEQIMTGAYARKWDDYAVLGIDTSMDEKFRYTLRYLVQKDTIVAPFYYNQPYKTQYRFYRAGKQDGLENSFKENGQAYRTYTFKDGRLHGVYREVLPWAQQEGGYVEVKGKFVADRREEEIHYYYNGQGHFLYKKVIIKKGKLL